MSAVQRLFEKAFSDWAVAGKLYVVGRIQDDFLSGRYLSRRTGHGARSISRGSKVLRRGSYGFKIGTGLDYMVYHHEGIPWHEIVAKNTKALRFKIGGKVIYRKRVFSPAQPAKPFIKDALHKTQPHVQRILDNLSRRAIREWPSTKIEINL